MYHVWEVHAGSFFLFFHPDERSGEKKTFQKSGHGTTLYYPTYELTCDVEKCVARNTSVRRPEVLQNESENISAIYEKERRRV